jgi:hypothetical protein
MKEREERGQLAVGMIVSRHWLKYWIGAWKVMAWDFGLGGNFEFDSLCQYTTLHTPSGPSLDTDTIKGQHECWRQTWIGVGECGWGQVPGSMNDSWCPVGESEHERGRIWRLVSVRECGKHEWGDVSTHGPTIVSIIRTRALQHQDNFDLGLFSIFPYNYYSTFYFTFAT